MKKSLLKRILAVTLSSALILAMAGCSSSSSSSDSSDAEEAEEEETEEAAEEAEEAAEEEAAETESSGETVTLSFYIWSDEENYISKVVDQFNSEQDAIYVDMTVVAESEYDDKLKVMLAGGTEADIVDIRGMAQTSTYANQGALLDITEYIEASDLDTSAYGDLWEESRINGSFYALPTRTTCWALFYNADILEELGIDEPGQMTWDEYIDYSLEIQEAMEGKTAEDGTALTAGFWVPWIYHFYAVQSGVYADDTDTTTIQQSLELLNELWTNGSHYTYEQVSSDVYDYMTEFENGHTALLPNGEWCVNMLMEAKANGETDINWKVAPMPVPEGVEDGTSWGQFQFCAITSTTEHPDEAYEFLEYLCGPEGAEVYASTGMIHAYSTDGAAEALIEASGVESASVLFEAKKNSEQPSTTGYDEFVTALSECAQLYFLGETDIDTCMADFTALADELREEYGYNE